MRDDGDRIAALRAAAKLTQQDVATKLGVAKSTVSAWENGRGQIDITHVPALAELFNVSVYDVLGVKPEVASLSPEEAALIRNLRYRLTDEQKRYIHGVVELLCKANNAAEQQTVDMVVYTFPAAAGIPSFAESDYERISFPYEQVPTDADFGVRILGNSMEPTVKDGSVVWVHQQVNLEDGEVGIFMLNDSAACKRLRMARNGRVIALESDNPDYEPITGAELEGLRPVGKVIGVYNEE